MRVAVSLVCSGAAWAAGLSAAALGPPARFNFRDAEFLHRDEAARAVDALLAARLPAGLPLSDARDRLVQAGMTCWKAAVLEPACSYSMVAHGDGGVIGEDTWVVRLFVGPGGTVKSWRVSHDPASSFD